MRDRRRDNRLCVFLGSRHGAGHRYQRCVYDVVDWLTGAGWGLVYGGANVGLMGALGQSAVDAGIHVTGVITSRFDEDGLTQRGMDRTIVRASHESRLRTMIIRSSAFLALPGGTGTRSEIHGVWTQLQTNEHSKPVALLNAEGHFDRFLDDLDSVAEEDFLGVDARASLIVGETMQEIGEQILGFTPPAPRSYER